jgi:transcriptional regulator with XRE-family HTH domain
MGQKAKDYRLVRTYTQMDLGDKIGVSHQQIQRYEQGVDGTSIENLCAIERYYQ